MNEKKRRTVFILAAGLGSRLKELTHDKPKALVEVNGKTMLETNIEKLINQGFNHIVINIHHFGDKIIDFLKDKKYKGIEIEISDERELLFDTGGAILKALPYFKKSEAVLIHNVDVFIDIDLSKIYDEFVASDNAVLLLTQNRNDKRKIAFDENDNYIGTYNLDKSEEENGIILKNTYKLLSFSGIHYFKPEYFQDFELKPCYVFALYKKISEHHNVKSHFIEANYWFDLGTSERIKEASAVLNGRKL